jgi:hypothetical protein
MQGLYASEQANWFQIAVLGFGLIERWNIMDASFFWTGQLRTWSR